MSKVFHTNEFGSGCSLSVHDKECICIKRIEYIQCMLFRVVYFLFIWQSPKFRFSPFILFKFIVPCFAFLLSMLLFIVKENVCQLVTLFCWIFINAYFRKHSNSNFINQIVIDKCLMRFFRLQYFVCFLLDLSLLC